MSGEPGDRLLHWDLHYDNILAGCAREGRAGEWVVLDPKPLAGDPGFELFPALDNRFDASDVLWRFDVLTGALGLDRERARAWTLGRVLQNGLWIRGAGGGCRRIMRRSPGGCWGVGDAWRRPGPCVYACPMIRRATAADVPAIHAMVRELAEYEKALDEANATEEQLREALFGERPAAYAHIAVSDEDGEVVGFALWFLNFSTWRGVHGVYLEDLYVRPERRGGGHGKALLAELARICVERGYGRLEWSVLDWNAPSIAFYESLGARPQDEWTVYRLTDGALAGLGGR